MAKAPQPTTETPATPIEPTATKKTRAQNCKKVYLDREGNESAHASPDAIELQFRFSNGHTKKTRLSDFPDNINVANTWHGWAQKGGDSYASAEDVDDAEEKFDSVYELLQKGEWIKVGERVGPPATLLADAYCRYLTAAGKTTPETKEGREKVSTWVKGLDKAERKSLSESPEVAPHSAAIKAERAIAAADKAAAQAKTATATVDLPSFA